jgi:hypothetical protein
MKINNYPSKIICAALIAAGLTFNVSSCTKDSTAAGTTVTEADAAQFTSDAVSPSSGGVADQLNSSITLYNGGSTNSVSNGSSTASVSNNGGSITRASKLSCGIKKDSTIVRSSAAGAVPSFNYSFAWDYTLACDGLTPSDVTFNFAGSGTYSGPLMSANHTSTGQLVLSGFGTSSTYLLTVNYTRNGTATSKIGKQYTFTSTLTIQSSNIAINKTTNEIVSGTATVTIAATSTSGKTFNFNGTINFLGGQKASLVLNSGATYSIQW